MPCNESGAIIVGDLKLVVGEVGIAIARCSILNSIGLCFKTGAKILYGLAH